MPIFLNHYLIHKQLNFKTKSNDNAYKHKKWNPAKKFKWLRK